jgi:hypothetical protein
MRKPLLLAVGAVLLAGICSGLRAEISAQAWLETYYLNPQPAQLPRQIHRLSESGYFDQPGHVPIAIGFISTIFVQHPQETEQWLLELNGLPLKHQRLIAAALWQAGHPLGAELLARFAPGVQNRADVEQLATAPSIAIDDTPVLSPSSMNLRWGAFLATGDARHIVAIFDAIGTDRPGLDESARLALARDAATHPLVMEICRAQLDHAPEEVRSVLRAAILEASAHGPST